MNAHKKTESDIITFTKANFHSVCRICFCDIKPPFMNIFSTQFKGESIANIINICIPKQALDITLPNNICHDCLSLLVRFKVFISQFQYADNLLSFVRDQLNNGNQEVHINHLTQPDIGGLEKVGKNEFGLRNSPNAILEHVGKASTDIMILKYLLSENISIFGVYYKESILVNKSTGPTKPTNLDKAKSKSTEHVLFGKQVKKPLFSLPLLITCNICKVDFFDAKIFQTHMKMNHPDQVLKCSICLPMKDFFDSEELKRHKIALHDLIECRKCDSLVGKTNIDKHIVKHHSKKNIVNASAETNGNDEEDRCKLHIIKTEKVDTSFLLSTETKCGNCFNIFQNIQAFEAHLLLCTQLKKDTFGTISTKPLKDKEMSCALCKNISFSNYTKFEQHCSKLHVDTVSCNICQSSTMYSKEAFKLHKLNAHKFVSCHICQCTIRPERMQKHMEIH